MLASEAALGVPVIAPVAVANARPLGSAGEIEKDTGAVPPNDVTGSNGDNGDPTVTVTDDMA